MQADSQKADQANARRDTDRYNFRSVLGHFADNRVDSEVNESAADVSHD
jgi:hypothetical protein